MPTYICWEAMSSEEKRCPQQLLSEKIYVQEKLFFKAPFITYQYILSWPTNTPNSITKNFLEFSTKQMQLIEDLAAMVVEVKIIKPGLTR